MENQTYKKGPVAKIFIRQYDNPKVPPKKITVPNVMSALIQKCQKILGNPKLQSVLDEKGCLLESIHDIIQMECIYLSPIDAAFLPRDQSRRQRSPEGKIVSKRDVIDENSPIKDPEQDEYDKSEQEKKDQLDKKTFSSKTNTSQNPYQNTLIASQKTVVKKKKVAPISKIDMRKISRPPSSSDDEDDDDDVGNADVASMSTKLSAYFMQHEDNSSDDETEEIRRNREEKKKKKLQFQSLVTIVDPKNQAFQHLIEEIIPPQEAPKLLEEGLDLLPPSKKQFIQISSDCEGEQLYLWIKGAANQPFLKRYPMQPYHDPITGIVNNFLIKHRHISNKEYVYRFKGVVIGPPKSGKSTLLGNAVDNYILDLAATGLWKSTFILAIDFKCLAPLINQYSAFYNALLDTILDAVSKQKPALRPHIPAVRRQLKSAIEHRQPILGIHPYRDVDSIAKNINSAWCDPFLFGSFLTHVAMLPVKLPQALGFKYVSLFVDNIEYADVSITPHEPFDPKGKQEIFVEYIKYSLNISNFILSSEHSEKLLQLLKPYDSFGVDLYSGIDYILPYDSTNDLGSRLKYDFLIECSEEPQPIRIDVGACGGIVPFLAAWDELHHSLFVLERTEEGTDQYDEVKYTCVADAQTLIDLLFIAGKKITVIDVSRVPKGRNEHLHQAVIDEKSSKASSEKL